MLDFKTFQDLMYDLKAYLMKHKLFYHFILYPLISYISKQGEKISGKFKYFCRAKRIR